MATHSSILACRIPWTEATGGLQAMGGKESETTKNNTFTEIKSQRYSGVHQTYERYFLGLGKKERKN